MGIHEGGSSLTLGSATFQDAVNLILIMDYQFLKPLDHYWPLFKESPITFSYNRVEFIHWAGCLGDASEIWAEPDKFVGLVVPQPGPHSQILMKGVGWGGVCVRQRLIFYTPKNHNFRICLPKKKLLLFLAYPKKSLSPFFATQKYPSVFLHDSKNPCVFHRPKKINFCQNFRPTKNHSDLPVVNICEWGPWGLRCF